MRIDIVTLFPELCDSFLHASILGRAADKGLFEAHCHQIRDYTKNKQKQTDDYPYGGGCGMVLYAQPIADCIRAVQAQCAEQGRPRPHVAFLTAAGAPYNEQTARRLATYDSLILVCGHYEGIDERVIEAFGDEEISIGDYVLTGGELASLVVADSVLRLQPGVLAEEKGYQEESYWDGLIEYPQYTRPEVWEGRAVPPVLLTGDHDKIDAWRGKQSRARTRARRPDLYDRWCRTHPLTPGSWKRNERAALVRSEEQLEAAARVYSESWQQSHEEICTPDFVAEHTPLAMRRGLGFLPAQHGGQTGRHCGRLPQDRGDRPAVCAARRPGQGHRCQIAGICPQKTAGTCPPLCDGAGIQPRRHCPLPAHELPGRERLYKLFTAD